ncbi:MAG TPA: polysaccharide deacetylase [Desulfobacteraceae bacterium]|nr:polysaccharide deacetylase [Desulfobacteraceae bacterium]
MSDRPSVIWRQDIPDGTGEVLREILQSAALPDKKLRIFFRADDIARVNEPFTRLMHLFLDHAVPLCLAVVPDWLDNARWRALQQFNPDDPLWCWHQHGRSHINHELQGKKSEFSDSRSQEAIRNDLAGGRELLARTMGDLFYPVFTPPWNRCGFKTLNLLRQLDFKAVSRSKDARPSAEGILADLAVNVDLHTRKDKDFSEGWRNLVAEFAQAADGGQMGIMLHHERMNDAAFTFLAMLLSELQSLPNIDCCTFRELL